MRCKTCGTINVEENPKGKYYLFKFESDDEMFNIVYAKNEKEASKKLEKDFKNNEYYDEDDETYDINRWGIMGDYEIIM